MDTDLYLSSPEDPLDTNLNQMFRIELQYQANTGATGSCVNESPTSNKELQIEEVLGSSTMIMQLKNPMGAWLWRWGRVRLPALESATGKFFFSWKTHIRDWHICGKDKKIIFEKRGLLPQESCIWEWDVEPSVQCGVWRNVESGLVLTAPAVLGAEVTLQPLDTALIGVGGTQRWCDLYLT